MDDKRLEQVKILKSNSFQKIYSLYYGSGEYVIKKEALTVEQCALLQHEASILSYLSNKHSFLKCPKLIYTNHRNIIIESAVPGKELDLYTIDEQNSHFMMQSILRNIARLQEVELEGFGIEYSKLDWKSFLYNKMETYEREIANIYDFDIDIFKPIIDFEYHVLEDIIKKPSMVLLHNDLNASNILYDDKGKIVSFIDFERWIVGDPIKEFSKLIWIFMKNKHMKKAFYDFNSNFLLDNGDILLLKAYFYFDILFHFSLYNKIKNIGDWPRFFAEEILLIKNFGDNSLWEK